MWIAWIPSSGYFSDHVEWQKYEEEREEGVTIFVFDLFCYLLFKMLADLSDLALFLLRSHVFGFSSFLVAMYFK